MDRLTPPLKIIDQAGRIERGDTKFIEPINPAKEREVIQHQVWDMGIHGLKYVRNLTNRYGEVIDPFAEQIKIELKPWNSEVKYKGRTRFERIQLEDGQLSLISPLPEEIQSEFRENLIKSQPWYGKGEPLARYRRRIEFVS